MTGGAGNSGSGAGLPKEVIVKAEQEIEKTSAIERTWRDLQESIRILMIFPHRDCYKTIYRKSGLFTFFEMSYYYITNTFT